MASGPERLGEWQNGWAEKLAVPRPLLRDTLVHFSGLVVATLAVGIALSFRPEFGWDFVAWSVLCSSLIFAVALGALSDHPFDRFGYANLVTAFRAALVSLVGAAIFCFEDLAGDDVVLLGLIGLVLFTLALDGVDGYLARRFAQESAFGARFDMEVDALMILILSGAAALLDKAGLWVVLIGLMRYGFIVAVWFDPRLDRELFPSFRRKLVCVVQVSALCLLLAPFVERPISTVIAAFSLALLTYSFAVDIRYLRRLPSDES